VSATLIAYDGRDLTETGRRHRHRLQFAAHGSRLFSVSVCAWPDAPGRGTARQRGWRAAAAIGPAGVAIDGGRGVLYEALGETRVIDPNGRAVVSESAVPLLARSTLAGHDAGHDLLYFVSPAGRLRQ
jgi:hypothetical protein